MRFVGRGSRFPVPALATNYMAIPVVLALVVGVNAVADVVYMVTSVCYVDQNQLGIIRGCCWWLLLPLLW